MLIILCGKSASGKDTTQKELVEMGFIPLVSTTDRPMRVGEQEGVEYFFKTKEEFTELVDAGKFLEYRAYKTTVDNKEDIWRYGTEKFKLEPGKNYVTIKDLSGSKMLKEAYGNEAMLFFLNVPDEVRMSRCEGRGDFDEKEWNRRLLADAHDFPVQDLLLDEDVNVLHHIMAGKECSAKDFANHIANLVECSN